jgi:hypothetical protein
MNSSFKLQATSFPALVALLFAGAAFAQGCGGDDNPIPTPNVSGGTGGASGSGGKGGKSSSGGGAGESEAGTGAGNEGGSGNDGSGGNDARGGSGNDGSGGSGNTGNRGGSGNTGNQGGEGAEGNEGGGGNEPGIDCEVRGANGCYRCEPEALDPAPAFPHSPNEQFLNHCDDSKGARFVNEERIPGFTGTDNLPALP